MTKTTTSAINNIRVLRADEGMPVGEGAAAMRIKIGSSEDFGEASACDGVHPRVGCRRHGSWPFSRSLLTSLEPMRPVPPITTFFMTRLAVEVRRGGQS